MEGVLCFIEYLFHNFRLRKLYSEMSDSTFESVASGTGRFFEVEGRLLSHEWHDGSYRDTLLLGLTKEQWLSSSYRKLIAGES